MIKVVSVGGLSMVAFSLLPVASRELFRGDVGDWSPLVLVGIPLFWEGILYTGGSAIIVTLLLLGALLALDRKRWLYVGILAGLATFKFNALPVLAVLFGYLLLTEGRTATIQLVGGGVVSQLPNIAYFVAFPRDLLLLVRTRGSLSWYANTVEYNPALKYLLPESLRGLYFEWFFVLVVLGVALGLAVSLFKSVPEGVLTSLTPTMLLLPGEPELGVLLAIAALVVFRRHPGARAKRIVLALYTISAWMVLSRVIGSEVIHGPIYSVFFEQWLKLSLTVALLLVAISGVRNAGTAVLESHTTSN